MRDRIKKLGLLSLSIFLLVFIGLFLAQSFDLNLSPRNKKFLELIMYLTLALSIAILIGKSILGYLEMVRKRDREILLDIVKIIGLIALSYIFINLIFNNGRLLRKNIIYRSLGLIVFALLSLGIAYDEFLRDK